jgi:hypothetical protein
MLLMLLIALTGEELQLRSLAVDEVEEVERRKEVRRPRGEKREEMFWKR